MEEYIESTTFRPLILAVASLLPGVGVALATGIDSAIEARVRAEGTRRIEWFLAELEEGSVNLGGPIPWHLADPTVHAAFVTLGAVMRSSRREKVKLLASLFAAGAGPEPRISFETEYEDYVKILDDLSIREIRLLHLLSQFEEAQQEFPITLKTAMEYWDEFQWQADSQLNLPIEECSAMLSRLTRTGTYQLFLGAIAGNPGDVGRLTPTYYRLSTLARFRSHLLDSNHGP